MLITMKKAITISLILFSLCLVLPSTSYAQENFEMKKVNIMPKDGLKFVLKRMGEKIMLTAYSIMPNKKCYLYQNLIESRLSELYAIAKEKDIANIETTSSRYSSTVGQATDYVLSKQLTDCKNSMKDKLSKHVPALKQAQEGFDYVTAEWRFIENDINTLKIYSEKLQ